MCSYVCRYVTIFVYAQTPEAEVGSSSIVVSLPYLLIYLLMCSLCAGCMCVGTHVTGHVCGHLCYRACVRAPMLQGMCVGTHVAVHVYRAEDNFVEFISPSIFT